MATTPIVAELKKYGLEAHITETVAKAISLALSMAGERDFICVTGSLFVVGEAIEQLGCGVKFRS
jgi:dihydrofolate synthase/folylpolyglutamate synthase